MTSGFPNATVHRQLLRFAAEALREHLVGSSRSTIDELTRQFMDSGSSMALDPESIVDVAGCFVTWRTDADGALRGCLGVMNARGISGARATSVAAEELLTVVRRYAVASATEDPRFPPIPAADFPGLRGGLTLLGERVPWPAVRDPAELAIGEEGLYVSGDGRSGVLLPQVAVEWEYDGEGFLGATCVKAGLPADAWRRADVDVSRFVGRELAASVRELLAGS